MKYLEHRCIALLDVLGLSRRIRTKDGLTETLHIYCEAIEYFKSTFKATSASSFEPNNKVPNFDAADFVFDTLVVVSRPLEEPDGAVLFFNAVSGLIAHFARIGMPLRGAVGIGDYAREGEIFLGTIFKELSTAEKCQEWAGCILLASHATEIIEIVGKVGPTPSQSAYFIRYDVPLKEGLLAGAWCVNWLDTFSESEIDGLLPCMEQDESKRKNTQAFFQYYKNLPQIRMPLPSEFDPAKFVTITEADTRSRAYF